MAAEKEVVIITGGARGIGLAIARKLTSRNINILISDIRGDVGEAAAKKIANDFRSRRFIITLI